MKFMTIGWFLAEEGGFGLNFDILETNLINLVIILGVLFYFGSKFLGKTLSTRKAGIEAAIVEAEKRKQDAAAALAAEQQKLAQAKQTAQKILADAEQTAARSKEAILAEARADVERMQAAAQQDLSSQQARVKQELQQRIAALAIQRSETELQHRINAETQHRLIDSSIALLEGGQ
jgi:F-type H+-transporting ATPase subunit b